MRIYELHRDDPLSWALMPVVLERVKKFCIELGSDHEPENLARLVMLNFVADEPMMVTFVGLENHKVVGHLLAGMDIDPVMDERYLTIIQYGKDKGINALKYKKELAEAYEKLCSWGLVRGAATAQLLTEGAQRVRLFTQMGFKEHRVLMRKPIEVKRSERY